MIDEQEGTESVVESEEGTQKEQKLSELEEVASDLGWTPPDKWRGNKDRFVDAKSYLRQREGMLKGALNRQDGELAEVKQTLTEFKGHYQRVEETAYKRAKTDLEKQRREAIGEGDAEAVERIQGEIDGLAEPPKPAKTNGEAGPTGQAKAELDAFMAANTWYEDDYEMGAYADQIATRVGKRFQGQSFYEELTKAVQKKFPDNFENPRRKRAQTVEEGGTISRKKGEKSYADLPPEAKAACDRFVKQGLMKKEDYMKSYEWD